ncbi:MAG TPA: di-heme oxidoredictase family protein [Burkholderiaceae bacterium]|nr:di-heme oxidoredictase family protein [Burkholderiaceae bacterium]
MRPLIFALVAGAGLMACNGGSDSDTPAAASDAAPTNAGNDAAANPAAETANAVRETVAAFERSTIDSTSSVLTIRPSSARDPGPRAGNDSAGLPLRNLTPPQLAAFNAGKADFEEAEEVDEGLGPTMNLDSCGGCHSQPAIGGTSPAVNPQVAFAKKHGMTNSVPPFITANGPVREARFVRNPDGSPDGGVHALFTIAGAAAGCTLGQPDFARQLSNRNVVFRIPTPVFGAGLIEAIPDSEIFKNQTTQADVKRSLGIRGRPNFLLNANAISGQVNRNGNDGTAGRFGWKAQNKSLLIFSGEAYNVEMGITNGMFPTERGDEGEACNPALLPNSDSTLDGIAPGVLSSIDLFTLFMRFLAPPTPSATSPGGTESLTRGRGLFASTGCALCHTPSMKTYNASVGAMRYQTANLFSDLLLHDMGRGLADGIQQGQAGGREFRTAPLWGLGQRLFFLHDGRTSDLKQAIREHASDGSEANSVTQRFYNLQDVQQQDLLNFLRSL